MKSPRLFKDFLVASEPLTPSTLKQEPDWALVERITGKKCPETVNLRELSRMTDTELVKTLKLSDKVAARLGAALALAERIAEMPVLRGEVFRTPVDVLRLFRGRAEDAKREGFFALSMDSYNRVIDVHTISIGSRSMTIVHPREAFLPVIRDSATRVIFAHNHPSGDPEPSEDDLALTKRLCECGGLLGIRVCDHIVVGSGGSYVSFNDRKLIEEYSGGPGIAAERDR